MNEKNMEELRKLESRLECQETLHQVGRVDEYEEQDRALEAELDRRQTEECLAKMASAIQSYSISPPLTFEEYQAGAKKTAIYNQAARVLYPALGLAGEVGEVIEKAGGISAGVDVLLNGMAVSAGKAANQVKKVIRDDDCECDTPRKHDIGKEIGGVLWYCAAVASDLGLSLSDIAQENLDILSSRQERGTIQGDGDNR
jgi:NTP pyrophosphatase (non-canonical NTP hydrolase)